jgi:hypothetical protein
VINAVIDSALPRLNSDAMLLQSHHSLSQLQSHKLAPIRQLLLLHPHVLQLAILCPTLLAALSIRQHAVVDFGQFTHHTSIIRLSVFVIITLV